MAHLHRLMQYWIFWFGGLECKLCNLDNLLLFVWKHDYEKFRQNLQKFVILLVTFSFFSELRRTVANKLWHQHFARKLPSLDSRATRSQDKISGETRGKQTREILWSFKTTLMLTEKCTLCSQCWRNVCYSIILMLSEGGHQHWTHLNCQ